MGFGSLEEPNLATQWGVEEFVGWAMPTTAHKICIAIAFLNSEVANLIGNNNR